MGQIFIHPGYVHSATDGDRHMIGARDLARCYGLSLNEVTVVPRWQEPKVYNDPPGSIHLYPRYHGDYHEELDRCLRTIAGGEGKK